ncbi:diguanylate cyclase domain-containing protein [Pantoea sp. App145]|uniref:diguanylate cyclase domain-containing protein n=1 Tax=Pantoea sp. App145 TaxID=3071567 RepID=UPI003A7FB0A4
MDITADITQFNKLNQHITYLSQLNSELNQHAIVVITEARGIIINVNDKFCEISQYTRDELLGNTHRLINSGFHGRDFFKEMWKTIKKGQVWKGEFCNKRKTGSLYWVYTTIVPLPGANHRPSGYIAIRTDITSRKNADNKIYTIAFYDALTSLPNRRFIMQTLEDITSQTHDEKAFYALMIIDLDHFKEVNDTSGHNQGDELLCQVAERLKLFSGGNILAGRLGGDEFVVLVRTNGHDHSTAVMSSIKFPIKSGKNLV